MSVKTIAIAAAISIASLTSAFAQNPLPTSGDTLVRYADVEGWTVYKNQTRGDCLIVSDFDTGAVQMGVTNDASYIGYLGIFTKYDIGIEDGKQSPIFISIDGRLYEGVATGISNHIQGGYSGGYIETTPMFLRDVAKRYKMVVFPDTAGAFVVDLSGTFNAMKKARECFTS